MKMYQSLSQIVFFSNKINHLKETIVVEEPEFLFWSMVNFLARQNYKKWESCISSNSIIHPTAYVSNYNVKIGCRTIVEPNVVIHPDVEIGENCIIRSGAVIELEGFEHKQTKRGVVSIFHDGKVVIDDYVEIGGLNSIAKGFMGVDTIIKSQTKTDSLVHIAAVILESCV
ncbi:hypothetical protein CMK13_15430 [Candidatus Poribacteria bacterium]|nr:hypothetical protein [Candidatus Poribacteria bacterium]OUT57138.1 MAG: hypothetical protein CBB75_14795 [bacterium TMED15]